MENIKKLQKHYKQLAIFNLLMISSANFVLVIDCQKFDGKAYPILID